MRGANRLLRTVCASQLMLVLCVPAALPFPAQAEQARTVERNDVTIVQGQDVFVAYDLSAIPLDQLVILKLKVTEIDNLYDFKPNTAKATSVSAEVGWKAQNDLHVCDAESNKFPRNRTKYAATIRGEWQALAGGKGRAIPPWIVTVFQVLIDDDAIFTRPNNKLLATGEHRFSATVLPKIGKGAYLWSYPNALAENFKKQDSNPTTFTAPTATTPANQRDQSSLAVRFTPANSTESSVDARPLNTTAPLLFGGPPDGNLGPFGATGPYKSNDKRAKNIFDTSVRYDIFDQFGESIATSNKGGRTIEIREDADPVSALPQVTAWARRKLNRSLSWRSIERPDFFVDGLTLDEIEIRGLLSEEVAKGVWRLNDDLVRSGVVFRIRPHVWHVSVSKNAATDVNVTDNVLELRIVNFQRLGNVDQFNLQFVYTVRIPNRTGGH